jgi:shikimate dehydrogenase
MSPVSAGTRFIGLLGDPVRHSLSPVFQNAAIRASGVDAIYLALRCSTETLPGLLRGIALAGGGGNVTVPHKRTAVDALDAVTDAVSATGACNTFWNEDGRVMGDNTDVAGFRGALRALVDGPVAGSRVLVLGAGGASRAVLQGLREERVEAVDDPEPHRERGPSAGGGVRRRDAGRRRGRPERVEDVYDVVVNATSLGLREDDPAPFDPERIAPGTAVLDLVYRPGGTAWVETLRSRGRVAADGTEMLVRQGAAAFERWFAIPAPIATMRAALEHGE